MDKELLRYKSLSKNNLQMDEIIHYFKVLSAFHKKAMGYDGELINNTGKEIEDFKDNIRKLKHIKKSIMQEKHNDEMSIYFAKQCSNYISIGEKCIRKMYNSGFEDILKRSIKRKEVCTGKKYDIELNKDNEVLISNINKCCFNFIEIDAIKFLIMQRKNKNISSLSDIIEKFCCFEGLNKNSFEFIRAAVNYPNEVINYMKKYEKKCLTQESKVKFINKVKKLIDEDEVHNH
ncbi:MAG: hypothetical protein Q8900_07465 [Bacillota bacterium]|nr:hypothetical protein [Bacillota bacterium]